MMLPASVSLSQRLGLQNMFKSKILLCAHDTLGHQESLFSMGVFEWPRPRVRIHVKDLQPWKGHLRNHLAKEIKS